MATVLPEKPVEAIVAHHAAMARELRSRVDALVAALALGDPTAGPADEIGDYVATELLPHAAAEEVTIYPAAEAYEGRLIQSLLTEHEVLRRLAGELAGAREGSERVALAGALVELFSVHARKENEQVVPAIVDNGVDLAALIGRIHELGEATAPAAVAEIDVRRVPHAQRHDQIFAALGRLGDGEAVVIVNDHDPKPLRYQIDALWPGVFAWTYRESGPERWAVRVVRRAA